MNIEPQGVKLQEAFIALLIYANDLALTNKSPVNLRSLFDRVEEVVKKVGLQLMKIERSNGANRKRGNVSFFENEKL